MAEDKLERILRVELPPCNLQGDGTGKEWDPTTSKLGGWQLYTGNTLVYWEGSIDLSGYALDKKTFYPAAAFTQDANAFVSFNGSGQTVWTVVSSIPRTIDELVNIFNYLSAPGFISGGTGPSIPQEQMDWNTVLYGETNINLINSTLPALGICQPVITKSWGSLAPTAADKLYVTKIVLPATLSSTIGDSLSIPASRIVIAGEMLQEPKLEYMMRLKRSYELANQV